jgi:CO/xanthine dehydrogenase FAD-binding subunit
MRGNAESHQMLAPGSLAQVLEVLATSPGKWTPIAGGTELMVAHAAGRLGPSNLVSLWALPELRSIRITNDTVAIGAAATFTDIRVHETINEEFPLLAKAASWIGSIANQNRATLGGNLANGSPAADSSPALLAYDAELELVSLRGKRRLAYRDFHTGYKRNILAGDELILAVSLPRRFQQHRQYLRKVGTRRAMAISKVALAGTARLEDGKFSEVRLAAASVAAYPTRLYRAEDALQGNLLDQRTIDKARTAVLSELLPIDDIRSTAEYRRRVTVNLLEAFLTGLLEESTS